MDDLDEARLLAAYREIFGHPDAGLVLLDLARICCFLFPSDQGRGAEDTAGNEGARRVFLTILSNSGAREQLLDTLGNKYGRRSGPITDIGG
jgi:hypothetical protein